MTIYTIELTERAEQEAESAYLWLSARVGPERAILWYDALRYEMQDKLTTMPGRFSISEDGCAVYPGTVVRQMLFGQGRSTYRVLFYIIEP